MFGEPQVGIDPDVSEWGNPPEVMFWYPKGRQTWGTETSKYPEEK